MVIQDQQTGSIWQQATGASIAGPLEGKRLELIGGSLMRWTAFRVAYPEGILATEPDPPAPNLLSVEGMVRLFKVTETAAGPGLDAAGDDRLPLHEVIIGIEVNGKARAYPLAVVRDIGTIEDVLGGQPVVLHYQAEGDRVEVLVDGKSATSSRQWWLGWSEFSPHTDIFKLQK